MKVIALFACRELVDGFRNFWLLGAISILAILVLLIAQVQSAPVGQLDATPLEVTIVGLTSLGVYLIPLIALLISFDSLVGELEQGTLQLLLTYPVRRWQLLIGKYLGGVSILVVAICVGYGLGGLLLMVSGDNGAEGWESFVLLIGSSILLGAVFIGIGILISALARKRTTAVVISLGAWLSLVVFYDIGLLGLLLSIEPGALTEEVFKALLLCNPADSYRVLNLSSPEVGKLVGIWGETQVTLFQALSMMSVWILISLAGATYALNRKQL